MLTAELKNITREYPGPEPGDTIRVLDNLSLSIPAGESIAVMGPSGSGKTTLLNILGTLDKPTSGEVIIHNQKTCNLQPSLLATLRNRHLGFVFQQHQLLPQLTVMENVLLPLLPVADKDFRESAAIRAGELLEKVGLKNHLRKFPAKLSVGECQRVAVVRALVNQPGLLLADEPTGSLDAKNALMLAELLAKLQEETGFSIVLVTHDVRVAERMKKIFSLSGGRLS